MRWPPLGERCRVNGANWEHASVPRDYTRLRTALNRVLIVSLRPKSKIPENPKPWLRGWTFHERQRIFVRSPTQSKWRGGGGFKTGNRKGRGGGNMPWGKPRGWGGGLCAAHPP